MSKKRKNKSSERFNHVPYCVICNKAWHCIYSGTTIQPFKEKKLIKRSLNDMPLKASRCQKINFFSDKQMALITIRGVKISPDMTTRLEN